jgi:hypothetical protein
VSIIDAARTAYAAGLCILPTRSDGSKAPALPSWKPYQETRPTPDQMRAWCFENRDGFGVVAGAASGYTAAVDFDDAATFDAFVATADATGYGELVARVRSYEDRTPSGGVRWLVRYPAEMPWKDETFARRPGRSGEPPIKTLIEAPTFAIVAPSNGSTHPSGKPYERVSGDFSTIASVTADEYAALATIARSFDEMPRPAPRESAAQVGIGTGVRPGDAFNRGQTWPALLEPQGWTQVFERAGTTYWRRPGKSFGISATTNHGGSDLLYVFTSSSTFDPDTSYSKFGAYTLLQCGGDYSQAALLLSQQGYGQHAEPEVSTATPAPQPTGSAPAVPAGFARPAVTGRRGDCVLAPLPGRPFSGWFQRGCVHLVAGSSGAGKTTLVLDLLVSQRRGASYLGHVGQRHDFLILFADRGANSNGETLERLRIDPTDVPIRHLPATSNAGAALRAIQDAIEAQDDLPQAAFIEGVDLLVEDASKSGIVVPFVTRMRAIAEYYNIAIVMSVGSPKMKPGEGYTLSRDRVFGSQSWSRLCDTVAVLSVPSDGTESSRDLVLLHRNDAAEKFTLEFADGRLVSTVRPPATQDDMTRWFYDVEKFTKPEFRRAFPKLSGARANELLDSFVAIGTLRKKPRTNDRALYLLKLSNPVPVQDTTSNTNWTDAPVPDNHWTGHGFSDHTHEIPKESEPRTHDLCTIKNHVQSSILDNSLDPGWTIGHDFPYMAKNEVEGGIQADDLPTFVTEDSDAPGDDDLAIAARDDDEDTYDT